MRKFLAALCAALGLAVSAPAVAAPPLAAFRKLPAVELAELSPSGNRYAVVAVVDEARRLIIIENDRPIANATVGEMKVRDVVWAGEDRVIVRFSKTYNLGLDYGGRYEIGHALTLNVATGKVTPILQKGRAGPTSLSSSSCSRAKITGSRPATPGCSCWRRPWRSCRSTIPPTRVCASPRKPDNTDA